MDYRPSDEQQMIVDTVRRFVADEIVPLEADLDPDAGALEPEDADRLVAKTKAMGFYGLDIPAEFGGPGLDVTTRALMAIEMSQHRAGLYNPCYGTFGGAGLAQLYEATDEQKERYLYPALRGEKKGCFALTEPSGGSDPARAIHRGQRPTATSGSSTDPSSTSPEPTGPTSLVFARTSDDPGRNGVTAFIVDTDTPGFNVVRVVHTLRSTHYATEISFDELRVSADQVLGEVNRGFAIANDRLSRQRIPYAAGCIGVAVKAQAMTIEWARHRESFGGPLAEKQAVQWMIVDNEIDIRHARYCVLEAAQRADRGERFRTEAAMAKLVATEASGRVIDRAMQIHGGLGMTKDLPLERWYRELRIRRVGEGPSEVQRLIMARELIGGSFK
ncbi:MAG: acyl-CoA dehydrogenase family protein [Acidimicrobiales bacterium]